ncbi:MAG: NUDIX hydrolase [Moorea sp. SIO2B7]|nr:NUDIX hydrolase [Moorena sp. SIO2B7]
MIFLINEYEEVFLFSKSPNKWAVVSGAIEANETVLESAYRELHEEVGENIKVSPIGVAHTHTFHYDQYVHNMISIFYVMRFESGEIIPGDDEKNSKYDWWSLLEIRKRIDEVVIPKQQYWMFERAVWLFKKYKEEAPPFEYYVENYQDV